MVNCLRKLRKLTAEQGEAVVGLGSSLLSIVALIIVVGMEANSGSFSKNLTPGLVFLACFPLACGGILVSLWALILRPGWIPILGILLGMAGLLAGLVLYYLWGISQLGAHPL